MGNINWSAIHSAYQDYRSAKGKPAAAPMPQPEQRSPMHNLVIHAMAMHPNKDGETHQVMILRALMEHLKRTTPDVSNLHKPPTPEASAGSR